LGIDGARAYGRRFFLRVPSQGELVAYLPVAYSYESRETAEEEKSSQFMAIKTRARPAVKNCSRRRVQMKKAMITMTAVAAIAAAVWAGGDVWKSKPYSQWDEKDINVILQNSPWARPGQQVQGTWRPADTQPADTSNVGVAGTRTDTSNRSAGATTNQPGGAQSQEAAQTSQLSYNVFWWSSRTIREANLRSQVLKGASTQEAADSTMKQNPDSYQILVAGKNMAIFQQRGESAFKQAAFLQTHKNKQKLSPTDVKFQNGADGSVVAAIFSFPKTTASGEPLIAPDEKEVDFDLEINGSWLRTNFSPKQMVDSLGEDL
jgi:hypothetical protein